MRIKNKVRLSLLAIIAIILVGYTQINTRTIAVYASQKEVTEVVKIMAAPGEDVWTWYDRYGNDRHSWDEFMWQFEKINHVSAGDIKAGREYLLPVEMLNTKNGYIYENNWIEVAER